MIKISKRLACVASLVLDSDSKGVLDVGCDHALLDIYLKLNCEDLKIIASDINKGPIEKARENLKKYKMEDKIKLVVGDGIDTYEDYVDTIVISGMGCETILEILNGNKEILRKIDRLVICSNNKYELLRREMKMMGFIIENEKIVKDNNKYYVAIKFIKGNRKYIGEEFIFGPILLEKRDNLFLEYLNYNVEKMKEILKKIPRELKVEREKLENEITLYEKILNR